MLAKLARSLLRHDISRTESDIMIAIGTLLPLASLAIKLGSKLLGDGTPPAQTEPAVQEEQACPHGAEPVPAPWHPGG